MTDDQIMTYVFVGLVGLLFVVIFWSLLGGKGKRRRTRRMHSRAHDSLGAGGHSWAGRHDAGGGDGGGGDSSGGGDGGGD